MTYTTRLVIFILRVILMATVAFYTHIILAAHHANRNRTRSR